MRLLLKTVAGKIAEIDVDPDLPLAVARTQAASALDLQADPAFVLQGRVLTAAEDARNLGECGFRDGSSVVAIDASKLTARSGEGRASDAAPLLTLPEFAPGNAHQIDADVAAQMQVDEDEQAARRVQEEMDGELARQEQTKQALGEERAAEMAATPKHVFVRGDIIACSAWIPLLVDTGAQASVLTSDLAARLGLLESVDRASAGIVGGVGQARCFGKLRGVGVRFGELELAVDFMVLDSSQMPSKNLAILGLDQLAVHHMVVDLDTREIRIGGRDGYAVRMLETYEIPAEFNPNSLASQRCVLQ